VFLIYVADLQGHGQKIALVVLHVVKVMSGEWQVSKVISEEFHRFASGQSKRPWSLVTTVQNSAMLQATEV
jgi:hypothetical protein